jgi:hypothetical protein
MVGSVIHDKNDGLSRIGMHQQVFEKLNEGLTVFSLDLNVSDAIRPVIVRANYMQVRAQARLPVKAGMVFCCPRFIQALQIG